MKETTRDLERTVSAAAQGLRRWSDTTAGEPLAAGKWSAKQTIGHLIDSASNNHQRFVRAQFQDSLVFPGYQQDDWVSFQRYQTAPWQDLIELWMRFNLHLARVIDAVPEAVGTRPFSVHNLNEIAWESPLADEPVTLDFFMQDYVNHLKHHLRQIDEELAEVPVQQLSHNTWKSA